MQQKQAEVRDTARVFAMAPAWLQTPAIQAQWQPRMEDKTAERSSSICIRFRQKPGKSEEPILQRQRALQGALKMVNEIQDRCWQQQTPFKRSEIELSYYRRRDVEWTGMIVSLIVLAVRTGSLLEMDVLVGCVLAFYIGNEISLGPASEMKWCPLQDRVGESSCRITSITARRLHGGDSRRNVFFGSQVKGQQTRIIGDPKLTPNKHIIRLIKTGTGGSQVMSRLGEGAWKLKKGRRQLHKESEPETGTDTERAAGVEAERGTNESKDLS